MTISNTEGATQPDLIPQPPEITEAAQDNLRSALELAKRTLSKEAIVETLHQGLDETDIVVGGSNDANTGLGKYSGRSEADIILISRMTPIDIRRARLIKKRRAERNARADTPQNDN